MTVVCADAALAYRRRGWSVLPLQPGEKRPLLRWEKFQRAPPGEAEIQRWYATWPEANVGIVTGDVSGLVVLDIDPKHGGDRSLDRLEALHGKLPATIAATTGGGGRHLYFAHPGGVVRNRAGLAQGIDLRGDGGYVVAPPSRHPSGRFYAWEPGSEPERVGLADLPSWLLDAARGRGTGRPIAHWRVLARQGISEGERNSTIASFTGHLLWHGVDPEVALELMLSWNRARCRPPLPDSEVAAVFDSILRLHRRQQEDAADEPGAGPRS